MEDLRQDQAGQEGLAAGVAVAEAPAEEVAAAEEAVATEEVAAAEAAEADKEEVPSVDAVVRVTVSNDYMRAVAEISPPQGEGKAADEAMLREAIQKAKVAFGLDEAEIKRLSEPLYSTQVTIAQGVPVQHGENGVNHELFARERERTFATRQDGSVDYKELNLIQDIEEGTLLCEISLPTPGADGTDVLGRTLKAVAGKPAPVLAGDGTRLDGEGTKILSAYAGNLVFKNGKFCVEKAIRVQKVDLDTGNIRFSGDVHVAEDVYEGFSIEAGGNIAIGGFVGACQLKAKGNIALQKGVNGKATIEAGKMVSADFIENARIIAGEKITAKSMINSEVSCEGVIEVTQGKGIICGGNITCFGDVKANVVGNEQHVQTVVSLGVTSKMLREREKINRDIDALTKNIDDMVKNVNYINRLVEDGRPIPSDRLALLQKTKLSLPISQKRQDKLVQDLAALDEKLNEIPKAALSARMIYPPTTVKIGSRKYKVDTALSSSRIYCNSEGEIVTGMKT